MKSTATPRFWQLLNALPADVQALAEKNYRLWAEDPQHPSLHFKRLAGSGHRFSVRVGDHYRAIGWKVADGGVEWVWIGSHAEYDLLLKRR
ncbi:hypothetical protein WJU23_07770 [Prosthecobacter sp. SYSU 5D2]|uniref:ParE family toxin-like protein n=1 Tax=Prosthecobacter sp. SYSU 5D2 TaxID=3134134 RepID=UPI0031FE7F9D